MGTIVRDLARLGLPPLPPSARSWERHRALSAVAELQFVGLTEALELTLLLADGELAKYERAALRWHVRFVYESKNVDIRESQAVLVLLAAIPANRWLRPRWQSSSVDGKASSGPVRYLAPGRGRRRTEHLGSQSRLPNSQPVRKPLRPLAGVLVQADDVGSSVALVLAQAAHFSLARVEARARGTRRLVPKYRRLSTPASSNPERGSGRL
jgi:hypothetical protein